LYDKDHAGGGGEPFQPCAVASIELRAGCRQRRTQQEMADLRPNERWCGLLEWQPWRSDRVMGLNHQLAALSCAIAEAFYLNRTLVFPSALCLDVKHEARWHTAGRKPSASCVGEGHTTGFGVPTSSLLDLRAIGRLVPLELRRLDLPSSGSTANISAFDIDRSWRSDRVARELPCERAPLVRRRVSGYWFRPCAYNIVQCDALTAALDSAVDARGRLRASQSGNALVPQGLLRSGIFYAAPIRAAAAAVRRALGGPYAAVHVRRSDRLKIGCGRECAQADALTRPNELLARLQLWYPPGTVLYVGSTEPPSYFAALRAHFNLSFAEDFRASALSSLESNYALYAAETLIFFGAGSMVETFGYSTAWISHACFPASGLLRLDNSGPRARASIRSVTSVSEAQRGLLPRPLRNAAGRPVSQHGMRLTCADSRGVVVNGVYYGPACTANPPCGSERMSLIPEKHDGERAAKKGCGKMLQLADVPTPTTAAACERAR